jgi:hypothetical protein
MIGTVDYQPLLVNHRVRRASFKLVHWRITICDMRESLSTGVDLLLPSAGLRAVAAYREKETLVLLLVLADWTIDDGVSWPTIKQLGVIQNKQKRRAVFSEDTEKRW